MDPADELQAPLANIQTNDSRTEEIQVDCPLQERMGKGSIVDIGGREEKEHR